MALKSKSFTPLDNALSNPRLEDEIYLITLLYTSDHGLANIASIGFMTDKKRKSQELIENSPLFCHFLDDVFGFFFWVQHL